MSRSKSPRRRTVPAHQINFKMPGLDFQCLKAAVDVLEKTQSQILTEAFRCYVDALPATQRDFITKLLAMRDQTKPDGPRV